ncbi:MAG: hypothetical protein AAF614_27405 [Chloroflexota bacterium]
MLTNKIVCPKCELADRIQKVSAIIAAGTSRQANTTSGEVSVTDLASILSLPNPPKEPLMQPILWWDKVDLQKWLIMIFVPIPLAWIMLSFFLNVLLRFVFNTLIPSSVARRIDIAYTNSLAIPLLVISLVLAFYIVH